MLATGHTVRQLSVPRGTRGLGFALKATCKESPHLAHTLSPDHWRLSRIPKLPELLEKFDSAETREEANLIIAQVCQAAEDEGQQKPTYHSGGQPEYAALSYIADDPWSLVQTFPNELLQDTQLPAAQGDQEAAAEADDDIANGLLELDGVGGDAGLGDVHMGGGAIEEDRGSWFMQSQWAWARVDSSTLYRCVPQDSLDFLNEEKSRKCLYNSRPSGETLGNCLGILVKAEQTWPRVEPRMSFCEAYTYADAQRYLVSSFENHKFVALGDQDPEDQPQFTVTTVFLGRFLAGKDNATNCKSKPMGFNKYGIVVNFPTSFPTGFKALKENPRTFIKLKPIEKAQLKKGKVVELYFFPVRVDNGQNAVGLLKIDTNYTPLQCEYDASGTQTRPGVVLTHAATGLGYSLPGRSKLKEILRTTDDSGKTVVLLWCLEQLIVRQLPEAPMFCYVNATVYAARLDCPASILAGVKKIAAMTISGGKGLLASKHLTDDTVRTLESWERSLDDLDYNGPCKGLTDGFYIWSGAETWAEREIMVYRGYYRFINNTGVKPINGQENLFFATMFQPDDDDTHDSLHALVTMLRKKTYAGSEARKAFTDEQIEASRGKEISKHCTVNDSGQAPIEIFDIDRAYHRQLDAAWRAVNARDVPITMFDKIKQTAEGADGGRAVTCKSRMITAANQISHLKEETLEYFERGCTPARGTIQANLALVTSRVGDRRGCCRRLVGGDMPACYPRLQGLGRPDILSVESSSMLPGGGFICRDYKSGQRYIANTGLNGMQINPGVAVLLIGNLLRSFGAKPSPYCGAVWTSDAPAKTSKDERDLRPCSVIPGNTWHERDAVDFDHGIEDSTRTTVFVDDVQSATARRAFSQGPDHPEEHPSEAYENDHNNHPDIVKRLREEMGLEPFVQFLAVLEVTMLDGSTKLMVLRSVLYVGVEYHYIAGGHVLICTQICYWSSVAKDRGEVGELLDRLRPKAITPSAIVEAGLQSARLGEIPSAASLKAKQQISGLLNYGSGCDPSYAAALSDLSSMPPYKACLKLLASLLQQKLKTITCWDMSPRLYVHSNKTTGAEREVDYLKTSFDACYGLLRSSLGAVTRFNYCPTSSSRSRVLRRTTDTKASERAAGVYGAKSHFSTREEMIATSTRADILWDELCGDNDSQLREASSGSWSTSEVKELLWTRAVKAANSTTFRRVLSKENEADGLSKPLSGESQEEFENLIGIKRFNTVFTGREDMLFAHKFVVEQIANRTLICSDRHTASAPPGLKVRDPVNNWKKVRIVHVGLSSTSDILLKYANEGATV